MTEDNELINAMALAIFNCPDPHTGDEVGHTIHSADEHVYQDGNVIDQLKAVRETCLAAARAALTAYRNHEVVL